MTLCPECFATTKKASYQLKNLVKIVNSKRLCKDDVHILKILSNYTDNDNNILCICLVCRIIEKVPFLNLTLFIYEEVLFVGKLKLSVVDMEIERIQIVLVMINPDISQPASI